MTNDMIQAEILKATQRDAQLGGELTKSMREDSVAMKTVSYHPQASREVALVVDSFRQVAIVTMVFLPGTSLAASPCISLIEKLVLMASGHSFNAVHRVKQVHFGRKKNVVVVCPDHTSNSVLFHGVLENHTQKILARQNNARSHK